MKHRLNIFKFVLIFFSLFLIFPLSTGRAQSPILDIIRGDKDKEDTAAKPQSPAQKIQSYLEIAQKQLGQLRNTLNDPALDPNGELVVKIKAQESRWEELLLYYTQLLESQAQQIELEKQSSAITDHLSDWESERYLEAVDLNFDTLNSLEDKFQINQNQLSATKRSLETLKTNLEENKTDYKEMEAERRKGQEALENTNDPQILNDLKQKVALLKVEAKIAEAKVLSTQQEIANESIRLRINQNQNDLFQKQLNVLKGKVRFSEEDLQGKLKLLEGEKRNLVDQLSILREKVRVIQQKIDQETKSGTEGMLSSPSSQITQLQEEKNILQTKVGFLSQRFQRLDETEEAMRRRYLAYNNLAEKTRLVEWKNETEDLLEATKRQEKLLGVGISDLNKNLNQINDQLATNGALNRDERNRLNQKKYLLEDLTSAQRQFLTQLYRESQLYQKLLLEIEPQTSSLSLGDQASTVWNRTLQVWNYEITSIDDKPITVKKLIFVLILSILGFRFSRKLSRWLGRKLLPKFGFEEGVAAGLQTLSFYLLVTLVTLLVLYIVNVPLTIFTVLGGALAIGVGFGSQNILRNFISGLILLAERPIRIGDLIQVDETYGSIERIGARSTLIRSFDNIHIILPNSDFLEKKVINWTLSDDLVRIAVNVGVVYGSPTRDVATLIKKAVTEHGKVIPEPEPIVLFMDFGASSLDFQVLFWIRMRSMMDRRRVESDIRYRIDSLFREAGIIIAFPQRDVHLDSVKPLEIKILQPSAKPGTENEEKENPDKDKSTETPNLQKRLEEHKAKKKVPPPSDTNPV